jgi:Arc/MetJ family transcription regulator
MNRRTTIELDEVLLADAQEALGTKGVKRTIEAALTEVVRASLRRRLAARLRSGPGVELSTDLLSKTRPAR